MASNIKDPDALELLNSDSRYLKSSNVVTYNGVRMYDIPYSVTTDNSPDDEFLVITSKYVNRYDKISYDKYANSRFWWVLSDINNKDNPFELNQGTTLRIPSLNNLILNEVI